MKIEWIESPGWYYSKEARYYPFGFYKIQSVEDGFILHFNTGNKTPVVSRLTKAKKIAQLIENG